MNKLSKEIIDWLEYSILSLQNNLSSKEKQIKDFKSRFNKTDLETCLSDSSIVLEDMKAIKEMMTYFFDEELDYWN